VLSNRSLINKIVDQRLWVGDPNPIANQNIKILHRDGNVWELKEGKHAWLALACIDCIIMHSNPWQFHHGFHACMCGSFVTLEEKGRYFVCQLFEVCVLRFSPLSIIIKYFVYFKSLFIHYYPIWH
jgi:hypothetical protein